MADRISWDMGTSYHPPVGFQKRGHNEFYWVSSCNRWHVRPGNFGTTACGIHYMILTDRDRDNCIHVVKGKMPEVEAMIEEILSSHPREYSYER